VALSWLRLKRNYIDDDEAMALAAGTTTVLAVLDVTENEIGPEGALALCNALGKYTALKELNLGKNGGIGDAGAVSSQPRQHRARFQTWWLQTRPPYRDWFLSTTPSTTPSDALRVNTPLTLLGISGNAIGCTHNRRQHNTQGPRQSNFSRGFRSRLSLF
jgi:hypothetical protein